MSELVHVSQSGGVATVRLARAAKRNALDLDLAQQLANALQAVAGAGAIVLLAEGDHFCVGGDVGAFAAAADRGAVVARIAGALHDAVRSMVAGPPVVVGVRGWAAGAGMSLVLVGDLAVGGESAAFRPAYPGIGFTPDGGLTWTLPRAVGRRRAAAILLEDRALTAAEALAVGLLDHVVPDDEVDSTAWTLAARLADGPREAYAGIKRLVGDGADRTLHDQLDAEAAGIAARAASAEGGEGIAAFAGRRSPDFAATRQ